MSEHDKLRDRITEGNDSHSKNGATQKMAMVMMLVQKYIPQHSL